MWEGVGDRTELQHICPHSYSYQRFYPVLLMLLNRGPRAQLFAKCCFLYTISPTLLIPKLVDRGSRELLLLGAGFLYHISSPNWSNFLCTQLYNSSRKLNILCTSAVFGMACLIVIERKWLLCSSQVTLFRCISFWLYRGILTLSHIVSQARPLNGICISAVFGMACLAGSEVNIQKRDGHTSIWQKTLIAVFF